MLKFSRSVFSSLPNGLQLPNQEVALPSCIGKEPIAGPVEDAARVVERVVEQPAKGHDAVIAVLAEVVEEERTFGGDETLDRLDEELVGERRLEPADPHAELGVEIEVDEDVKDREGIKAVRERDEVADRLA